MDLERLMPFNRHENDMPMQQHGELSAELVDPEVLDIELMRYEIVDLTPDKEVVIDLTTLLVDRQGQELGADEKRRIRQMISIGLHEIFKSDSLTDEERAVWQTRVEPRAAEERKEFSGIVAAWETANKNNYEYDLPETWDKATQEFAIRTGAETVEIPDTPAEIFNEQEEPPEETISGLGYVGIYGDTESFETVYYQVGTEADYEENVEVLEEDDSRDKTEAAAKGAEAMVEFEEDVRGDVPTWEAAARETEALDRKFKDQSPVEVESSEIVSEGEYDSTDDEEILV